MSLGKSRIPAIRDHLLPTRREMAGTPREKVKKQPHAR